MMPFLLKYDVSKFKDSSSKRNLLTDALLYANTYTLRELDDDSCQLKNQSVTLDYVLGLIDESSRINVFKNVCSDIYSNCFHISLNHYSKKNKKEYLLDINLNDVSSTSFVIKKNLFLKNNLEGF
jgi:hypothetical protein